MKVATRRYKLHFSDLLCIYIYAYMPHTHTQTERERERHTHTQTEGEREREQRTENRERTEKEQRTENRERANIYIYIYILQLIEIFEILSSVHQLLMNPNQIYPIF